MTMNDTWGFKKNDENWKSPTTLVRMLIDTTSKGGNFLLNVGPTSEGLIPQASIDRFAEMGRWMKVNSESIYGAGPGPFAKLPWGRCSAKKGVLYLHVFNKPEDGTLVVPGLLNEVTRASLLARPADSLSVQRSAQGYQVKLPPDVNDPHSLVVKLEIVGEPAVLTLPAQPGADGKVELRANEATVRGGSARYEDRRDCIGFWTEKDTTVEWDAAPAPGRYRVVVTYACEPASEGSTYTVMVGDAAVQGAVAKTASWGDFVPVVLGEVEVKSAKGVAVKVTPRSKPGLAVMNLRSVTLEPLTAPKK